MVSGVPSGFHISVEEPSDLAGGNGGVIDGEFWGCVVPWPAEAALAKRLSIYSILSHTEVPACILCSVLRILQAL